jgi:hypothetical protein
MLTYNSPKKSSQNNEKQGAIERYYALLGSGHSGDSNSNNIDPIRGKSEHDDTVITELRKSKTDGVPTDIIPEITVVGTAPEKARYTRGMESCRTEEPQPIDSAPLDKLDLDNREQLLRGSLSGSEPDVVKPAGAHTYVDREQANRFGDQKRPRLGRFPRIRKRIVFLVLCAGIGVSVSIAGFSIVHGNRDAELPSTRVQSDISSRTEPVAIPGPAADRSQAGGETQKSQKRVTNADSWQVHTPSRPEEPGSAIPGTLQGLSMGVQETGSAARQEVESPQRSNAGQVDAIHQPTAPHSDTGQPSEAIPKDKAKATATVPTENMSAALSSRFHAIERRRASTPRLLCPCGQVTVLASQSTANAKTA